uniref:Uncharacterized protein n=1 Tax=candidate division WOR-3 bacterium TaxID=2052148 RepID=A0A7V3RI86_UNCW3
MESLKIMKNRVLRNFPNTHFNVSEVIEKVIHHPIREGERIVIKGMVYEAYFDEGVMVLKPR